MFSGLCFFEKQFSDSLERFESWVVVTDQFHIPNHKKTIYIHIYIIYIYIYINK